MVTVNQSIATTNVSPATICTGDSAMLTATGGGTYLWSTGSTASSMYISPTATTNYTVLVTNGICSTTAVAAITIVTSITANINAPSSICTGNNLILTASGGSSFSWSNGATTASITVLAGTPDTTTYSVMVSSGTCLDDTSITINVNPTPVAIAWNNVTITAGNSTTLSASGNGNYLWSNGITDTAITVSPPATTVYCVIVSNSYCADTACVTVTVELIDCSPAVTGEFFLPNAFSPNGDNDNDMLKIYYGAMQCIQTFELHIYNRWGEKVFQITDPAFYWDGNYKEERLSTQVLVYYLKATLITTEEIIKKGNINLVR